MKANRKKRLLPLLLLVVLALASFFTLGSQAVQAIEEKREFLLFFKYPSVTVSAKETLDLELMVINKGEKEEQIILSIIPGKKAKEWDVGLENRWDKMRINSVGLLTEDPDDSITLKFNAKPPEDIKEGKYEFIVKGITVDKKIERFATLTIDLKKEEVIKEEVSQEVSLAADYPSIENPAGKEFKFAIEVKNRGKESLVLDLGVDYPLGWRAYVSPKWEEDKKISSVKVNASGSENIILTLISPLDVSKGDYPIKFVARHQDLVEAIDLKATITGTYRLIVRTETARLNLDAIAGEEETLGIYLWNEGSTPIEDISFFVVNTPEDWKISFDPEKIPSVPSYQEVKKPEKIKLSITPPPRTLPGDYMFTVKAVGQQDQNDMDLRVTVKRSTMWGLVGVGIVVVIIVALVGVFIKLGRR